MSMVTRLVNTLRNRGQFPENPQMAAGKAHSKFTDCKLTTFPAHWACHRNARLTGVKDKNFMIFLLQFSHGSKIPKQWSNMTNKQTKYNCIAGVRTYLAAGLHSQMNANLFINFNQVAFQCCVSPIRHPNIVFWISIRSYNLETVSCQKFVKSINTWK